MREHQNKDAAGDCENCPKHQPYHCCLLGAGEPLRGIVGQGKYCRRDQHGCCLRPHAASQKLAQPLKHVSAKDRLFTETGSRDQQPQCCRNGGAVSRQIMKGLVDLGCAEQRHEDRLHQQLKTAAECYADCRSSYPVLRLEVADFLPRSARPVCPHQRQHRAQWNKEKIAGKDDNNGQNARRPEAAQALRKSRLSLRLHIGRSRRVGNFKLRLLSCVAHQCRAPGSTSNRSSLLAASLSRAPAAPVSWPSHRQDASRCLDAQQLRSYFPCDSAPNGSPPWHCCSRKN